MSTVERYREILARIEKAADEAAKPRRNWWR